MPPPLNIKEPRGFLEERKHPTERDATGNMEGYQYTTASSFFHEARKICKIDDALLRIFFDYLLSYAVFLFLFCGSIDRFRAYVGPRKSVRGDVHKSVN